MSLIDFSFDLNDVETLKVADMLADCGYLRQVMHTGDTLKCNYRFVVAEHPESRSPQRIIDLMDHMKPETFKINNLDLYQINRHIETLQGLLRLAEKMRTMARFIPAEKPKPVEKKKSWFRNWWS